MFQEQVNMALHGGASQAMGIDPVALSRRPLPTRAYLLRLAPHRCRDQMVYQANWLTYANLSSHRLSEIEWHIRMHGAFKVPYDRLGIRRTDQRCHHEVRVHLLHVNARQVDRTSREDERPSLRKRNSLYDHSKERSRAVST